MIIHFKRDEVERLIKHSLEAKEHESLYEQPDTVKPGLWLVGDEGVYLMSNASEGLKKDPDDPKSGHVVAYAVEICPVDDKGEKKPSIDDWWEIKREAFGGDDGADFLPYEPDIRSWLESNDGESILQMDLTPKKFILIGTGLGPIKVGAVKAAAGGSFDRLYQEGLKWTCWGIPVSEMDRPGMVAYVGVLKETNRKLQAQLDAARRAGAIIAEPKIKPRSRLKVPRKLKK